MIRASQTVLGRPEGNFTITPGAVVTLSYAGTNTILGVYAAINPQMLTTSVPASGCSYWQLFDQGIILWYI